ncbi:MAG: hypothetical protein ACYC8T_30845 [Myxococcaceae bacterium]
MTKPLVPISLCAAVAGVLLSALACGGKPADLSLNVAWTFSSGDCTSNSVTTVRVSWGPSGETLTDVEFPCTAGGGKLGELSPSGSSYTIRAEGLDSGGVARVTHFGTTLTASSGTGGEPVDLMLRPKPSNVVVTWSKGSTGCPTGVVLPYFAAIYNPPAQAGGPLTSKVKEVQETCSKRTATLTDIAPGAYVVELDSRAVTPSVRGRKDVTVVAGEGAQVAFQF